MSSLTWTPDALSSEARRYEGRGWRLVEAQHQVSTLKLVDTLEEQSILEDLIEETKPVIPEDCRHLDYLLATPFRYETAYPKGSRFRRAGRTRGVFYASERPETAVAEIVFYRLLFFAESPETPWPNDTAEYTAFAAAVATDRSIDLTGPPLSANRATWADPINYEPCQDLADAARDAQIDLIRYESVRDPDAGTSLAVLACKAFSEPSPIERRTWRIRLGSAGAQAICEFPRQGLEFTPNVFANDPRLASLGRQR